MNIIEEKGKQKEMKILSFPFDDYEEGRNGRKREEKKKNREERKKRKKRRRMNEEKWKWLKEENGKGGNV